MNIASVTGKESHTTSKAWSLVWINDTLMNWRDAASHEFLSEYGDKHTFWVECVWTVQPGDEITWKAGTNSGPRASVRVRQHLEFVVDPNTAFFASEPLGYPGGKILLEGKLRLITDHIKAAEERHTELKEKHNVR